MIHGLIGGVIAIVIWQIFVFLTKKRKKQTEEEQTEEASPEPTTTQADDGNYSNKAIVLESLYKMQCEPIINDKSENSCFITFEYQSEDIYISVNEAHNFVMMRYGGWYNFDADDIEQLDIVKKIINDINWRSEVTVCNAKSTDDNMYYLNIKVPVCCYPDIDFTGYLRHLLSEAFAVRNLFYRMLAESDLSSEL